MLNVFLKDCCRVYPAFLPLLLTLLATWWAWNLVNQDRKLFVLFFFLGPGVFASVYLLRHWIAWARAQRRASND